MPICSRSAGEVVVRLRLVDDSDVASARRHVRELGRRHAMSEPDLEALATAVSETVRNVIVHAERGELEVAVREGDERAALMVVVRGDEPGIPNTEDAMRDGYSTGTGLGLGLPSARRLVDVFELTTAAGLGTVVTLTKWLPGPASARR